MNERIGREAAEAAEVAKGEPMTESMRDLIRDELAGWPIGSGYYSTAVSVDNARDMADAVLAVLADLPDDVIEQAARGAYDGAFLKHAPAEVDRWDDLVSDSHPAVESWREVARQSFAAVFGGEQA